jgi:hypothetical protein
MKAKADRVSFGWGKINGSICTTFNHGPGKPLRVNNTRDHNRRDCRQHTVSGAGELRWVLCLRFLLLAPLAVHAQICTQLSPGTNIQSALNSCWGGSTAVFAAGAYTVPSSVSVPCGVSLAGPKATWSNPSNYTATLNFSGTDSPFTFSPCSTPISIRYLNFDGGEPQPNGGQVLHFPPGTSNVTISDNYFFGNQATADQENFNAPLVYFDGDPNAAVDSNITVSWNIFGQNTYGDCSNLMQDFYSGLSGDGGYCVGLGIHNGMSNLAVENNIFQFMEQGAKVFEAQGACVSCYFEYNDFNNLHRIGLETQANQGDTSMYVEYNDLHDQYAPNFGSWGFSVANGCPSGCVTDTNFNVLINNQQASGSGGGYTPGAIEMWGSNGTQGNYNLIQGLWANGIMIASTGQFVLNDNTFCMLAGGSQTTNGSGGYFNQEDGPTYTASASGNSLWAGNCVHISVAPVISPPTVTQSGTHVVLTNPGLNRDANTGIWVTTDATKPIPGSGTAQYFPSGQTLTVTKATTVKAVGMWGAPNQPYGYPAGYGYVPSNVVTRWIPGPSVAKTLVSAFLLSYGDVASIPVGSTLQFTANGVYSDGTVIPLPDSEGDAVTAWNTSNHAVAEISSDGHVTAVGVGTVTIEGMIGKIEASTSQVTVTAPTAGNRQ